MSAFGGVQRRDGSELRPTVGAELLGVTDPDEVVTATVVLRRRVDGARVPSRDYFLASPHRRTRLRDREFVARYGADPRDIARLSGYFEQSGLRVLDTNAARRLLTVAGGAGPMGDAFGVELRNYKAPLEGGRGRPSGVDRYRGYDGYLHLSAAVNDLIVAVLGLETRRVGGRNSGGGQVVVPVSVLQLTELYGFPANSARGQTIAIVAPAGAGYMLSDVKATFGGRSPSVVDVPVDAQNSGQAINEVTYDLCVAGLAAREAGIAVYWATMTQNGWVGLLSRVVHPDPGDPVCSVLSSSFYFSDGDDLVGVAAEAARGVNYDFIDAVDFALQDAAIQGVTVCISSGDDGSRTRTALKDGRARVQYPASDPWVLSVGGTTIANVADGACEEYAWADTGGGVSDYFVRPEYQSGAGVPVSINEDGRVGRGVPDVSANADPRSGYDGIVFGGKPRHLGGTSMAAPLWAGLIAVMNAAIGANVGFLNPALYAIGSQALRDITTPPGPTTNSYGGVKGYPVRVGWDACTGWGSPRGSTLLSSLQALFAEPLSDSGFSVSASANRVDALWTQVPQMINESWSSAPGNPNVAWGEFFRQNDGPTQQGTIRVVSTGATAISALWVDAAGALQWGRAQLDFPLLDQTQGWSPSQLLAPRPPAVSLAVCSTGSNDLDVIWTAEDGSISHVHTANATDNQPPYWTAPAKIVAGNSPPISAEASVITALSRRLTGELENWADLMSAAVQAFWITPEGAVMMSFPIAADLDGPLDLPLQIAPGGSAVPGAITAVARAADLLDVFWIDPAGGVRGASWNADAGILGPWTPTEVARDGAAAKGALKAIAIDKNTTYVFWIDPAGSVRQARGDGTTNPPITIPSVGAAAPVALSAVARTPMNISVCWFGIDGSVWVSDSQALDTWPNSTQILPAGNAQT